MATLCLNATGGNGKPQPIMFLLADGVKGPPATPRSPQTS